MGKLKNGIVILVMVILYSGSVYAHPGRTDSRGCHTCRNNCERWGLSYGQYHCHNGGSSSGSSSSKSTYTRKEVYGCTNSNAINYNSSATKDDGSCIAKVYGCTDSTAYNYNSEANTDDGSCKPFVYGCTDELADNYNSDANTGDGTCLYTKEKVRYEKIRYKKVYKNKLFRKSGTVLRKGKNGKRRIITEIVVNEKGEIQESNTIKRKVIQKPISKIIVK